MNERIKAVLDTVKAIHCQTEDEAHIVGKITGADTGIAGWNKYGDQVCFAKGGLYGDKAWFTDRGHDVVTYSSLVRSHLAQALGVDDEQEFWFDGSDGIRAYRVHDDRCQWRMSALVEWQNLDDEPFLCEMIANPEKITIIPKYSDETIAAARRDEHRFQFVARDALLTLWSTRPEWDTENKWWYCSGETIKINGSEYPEIKDGECVSLADIK